MKGKITGLVTEGLELERQIDEDPDESETIAVEAGATEFAFTDKFTKGKGSNYKEYKVTIKTQPNYLNCIVSNSSGKFWDYMARNGVDLIVDDVLVDCDAEAGYEVGGPVTGLTEDGLVLTAKVNGHVYEEISVPANATEFKLEKKVAPGLEYNVAIKEQAPGHECAITNGSGIMGEAVVDNIQLDCSGATTYHTVAGTVSGLAVDGLVLELNSEEEITVNASGGDDVDFIFETELAYDQGYNVQIKQTPSQTTCSISNNFNIISGDVTSVSVTCEGAYRVGGSISILSARNLILQLNGTYALAVPDDAETFHFDQELPDGDSYSVSISNQPDGETCWVEQGTGTISGSNISDVYINCGREEKRIFLLPLGEAKHGRLIGGISGADGSCENSSNKPQDGSTYKALIVDGTNRVACTTNDCGGSGALEHVDWVLQPNTTYRRASDNTEIGTTNSKGLFDLSGGLMNPVDTNQETVWTGLTFVWTTSTNTCQSWNFHDPVETGRTGYSDNVGTGFIQWTDTSCDTPGRLYCVEQ